MRLVFCNAGIMEVQWMWLPTFIGQNIPLMKQLEGELRKEFAKYVGQEVTEALLQEMHTFVVQWLSKKIGIVGLDWYLNAIGAVVEK